MYIPAIDSGCYCLSKHCCTAVLWPHVFTSLLFLAGGEQSSSSALRKQDKETRKTSSFPPCLSLALSLTGGCTGPAVCAVKIIYTHDPLPASQALMEVYDNKDYVIYGLL
ncbi:hypothetical protein XENOCAPTIV_004015 [Xenoophorus captivus]|uniref:Uncharacterized protein n=1 Tax=Xenoophorus captivus TaxID=1517983 RepID=A0ABV0RGN0_9TELE